MNPLTRNHLTRVASEHAGVPVQQHGNPGGAGAAAPPLFPRRAVPDVDTVRGLVALACRAPSLHNSQPWHWSWSGRRLTLRADRARHLIHTDPSGRDLLIGCGAALHHLQVASAAAGWRALVTRVPDLADPDLLAQVSFAPHESLSGEIALARAISTRRTDRRRVSSWPVPDSWLERFRMLGAEYGAFVLPVSSAHGGREGLDRLLRYARHRQHLNGRYFDELLTWSFARGDDGVPATSMLSRHSSPEALEHAVPRFPSGTLLDEYEDDLSPAELWLMLTTSSDDTLSRLRAGEALSSMWLSATLGGLSILPVTQPVEVDETRRDLQRTVLGDRTCPQLLMRVGWPTPGSAPVPPTARRPVEDVLSA